MSCLNEEEFVVVQEMSKRGGSFVKALAECFHHADHNNKLILKKAFPQIWSDYLSLTKWDNNLAEQADKDYKESKFSGDAYLQ
jgi:pyruvate/2-oxoacid:ferredoxin oxidoreductase beta subunit